MDNADPEQRSRIRVQVPQVYGEGISGWAVRCVPPGWDLELLKPHSDHPGSPPLVHDHNHERFKKVPDNGQSIWVMFVGGDPDHPVWIGTF